MLFVLLLIFSLLLLLLGGYFTFVAYRYDPVNHPQHLLPQYLLDHLKAVKIAGFTMLSAGVLGLVLLAYMYYGGGRGSKSNFGFQFY